MRTSRDERFIGSLEALHSVRLDGLRVTPAAIRDAWDYVEGVELWTRSSRTSSFATPASPTAPRSWNDEHRRTAPLGRHHWPVLHRGHHRPRARMDRRTGRGRDLVDAACARVSGGHRLYPAFQVGEGRLVDGFADVMTALAFGTHDPRTWAQWLNTRVDDESEETAPSAIEQLGASQLEEVLRDARHAASSWSS
ncbi:hypothetical protein J7E45_11405 [Microbacterium sp. ISL-59]|nr:hypothetical protein [Microbacterium sp. ISL-59]